VTPELLAWADVVFVMEPTHRAKLARSFPAALRGKRVVCLDVPDDYGYTDPDLVRLLRDRIARAVPALAADLSDRPGAMRVDRRPRRAPDPAG
jgi:predicted protein tyrosine phosphatase